MRSSDQRPGGEAGVPRRRTRPGTSVFPQPRRSSSAITVWSLGGGGGRRAQRRPPAATSSEPLSPAWHSGQRSGSVFAHVRRGPRPLPLSFSLDFHRIQVTLGSHLKSQRHTSLRLKHGQARPGRFSSSDSSLARGLLSLTPQNLMICSRSARPPLHMGGDQLGLDDSWACVT